MNINSQDIQDFYNSVDNPFDIPITENGLWEYPNQEVIVPTNGSITMKGVGYPVIGKSLETGEEKLMQPENDYFFENTSKVLEIPQFQNGGKYMVNNRVIDENDVKSFYNKMLNSDWYKQRLKNNGYGYFNTSNDDFITALFSINGKDERVNKIIDARNKNVQSTSFDPNGYFGSTSYKRDTKNLSKRIVMNPDELNYLKIHPRTAMAHEFGHAETDSYAGKEFYPSDNVSTNLSSVEKKIFENNKKNPISKMGKYVLDPKEAKSDLNSIRYNLYKIKNYNPSTGKYNTKDGLFNKEMIEKVKNDAILKRMKEAYGEDGLINVMNTIAQTENNNDIFRAQNGGIYGNRPDNTYKGNGFYGGLKTKSGDIMTEYSIGVEWDGKEHFLSYYDKWDLAASGIDEIDSNINKMNNPYEIYGRIYKKDLEDYKNSELKNVKKYQKGGIIDRETQVLKNTVNDDNDDLFYAQKGGSIDNENVKNFYNDMLNAPWYKERLNENGYMDSDNVISKRLKNINRIDFSVNNSVNTGYSQYKNLPSFLSNPNVTLNTNESDYLNTPYNDSISHEYGHGETKGYDLSAFEKSLIEDSYISNDNDKQVNYLKSPYETKSDINAIRYHLYNMGKYNPKTGEYDTDSKLFEPSLLNNDLENTIIKRMKDAYGDDNLKKLMNTVANTNSKDKGYNA